MKEYIEREAAIDACFYGWNNNAHDCAENIRAIPAADVRPVVRGRWIQHYVGQERTPWGSDCSVCGEWLVIDRLVMQEKYHYCPNCGADMREES